MPLSHILILFPTDCKFHEQRMVFEWICDFRRICVECRNFNVDSILMNQDIWLMRENSYENAEVLQTTRGTWIFASNEYFKFNLIKKTSSTMLVKQNEIVGILVLFSCSRRLSYGISAAHSVKQIFHSLYNVLSYVKRQSKYESMQNCTCRVSRVCECFHSSTWKISYLTSTFGACSTQHVFTFAIKFILFLWNKNKIQISCSSKGKI